MPITIYDISQKAGVSIATVSRVLNGSGNVKPSTRKKVMEVIEQYNYTPNIFARGMGNHSLKIVGILCADSSDAFFAKAVYLLEQELQANGYGSVLCCTGYNQDAKKNYLNIILSKKVDSIILVGSNFIGPTEVENEYIGEAATHVPIMVLNAHYDHKNVYSVLCDDYQAMYEATVSMIESGVRDILYIYNLKSYSGIRKVRGFKDAMKAHGIDPSNNICFFDDHTDRIEDITDYITSLTYNGQTFNGLIAAEDILAVGAVRYAQRRGLRIPQDLSIIGYNNSMLTACCNPELTSVDNRLETLTHQLVQTLLQVLDCEDVPKKTVFSGRLICRGTTLF